MLGHFDTVQPERNRLHSVKVDAPIMDGLIGWHVQLEGIGPSRSQEQDFVRVVEGKAILLLVRVNPEDNASVDLVLKRFH
ncbi:hypothetical protein D3C73_932720 [compost metagenome]